MASRTDSMQAQEHFNDILAALERAYGSPRHGNKDDPLSEIIYIKLSQQTNDPKFRAMYRVLEEHYPGWHGLERATQEELEEILRPGGFQRRRARDLRRMAAQILEDRGSLDLGWLSDLAAEEAIKYLQSLYGVGTKTAYCVAMYSLGLQVLPVDVHVQRISERVGLLPPGLSDKKKHQVLNSLVPPEKRCSFHVNCVSHGRQVCRKAPRCGLCFIHAYCAYFLARQEAETEQHAEVHD